MDRALVSRSRGPGFKSRSGRYILVDPGQNLSVYFCVYKDQTVISSRGPSGSVDRLQFNKKRHQPYQLIYKLCSPEQVSKLGPKRPYLHLRAIISSLDHSATMAIHIIIMYGPNSFSTFFGWNLLFKNIRLRPLIGYFQSQYV